MEVRPRIIGAFIVIFLAFFGGNMAITKISAVFNHGAFQNQEVTIVSPYIFSKLMEGNDVVIFDIRSPDDYQGSHIHGAENIDPDTIADISVNIDKIDPTKTYLIYTERGDRSYDAAAKMQELGFVKIVELDGGYRSWVRDGYPVENNSKLMTYY